MQWHCSCPQSMCTVKRIERAIIGDSPFHVCKSTAGLVLTSSTSHRLKMRLIQNIQLPEGGMYGLREGLGLWLGLGTVGHALFQKSDIPLDSKLFTYLYSFCKLSSSLLSMSVAAAVSMVCHYRKFQIPQCVDICLPYLTRIVQVVKRSQSNQKAFCTAGTS